MSVLQLLAAGRVGRLSFELPVTGSAWCGAGLHTSGAAECLELPPMSHVLIGCIMYPTEASFVFPPDLIGIGSYGNWQVVLCDAMTTQQKLVWYHHESNRERKKT